MRRLLRLPVFFSVFAVSCINTDAAIFVEAQLTAPQLQLQESSLATAIDGSAALTLHLGPRASGPSEVSLLSVSLLADDQQSVLVEQVAVRSEPRFPMEVGLDSDRNVTLRIDASENLLAADAKTTLCGATALVLQVVLDDGLRGAALTASSDPFALGGCP